MSPTKKIKVEDVEITIFEKPDQNDFICITDIVKLRNDEVGLAEADVEKAVGILNRN